MNTPFLTAEWRKLAMANYVVDPSILTRYLPYKTELDLFQGHCFVSLVGFMFLNTRIKGFRIPFHTNFEEVNLRFYVRYQDQGQWKRGVVFVSEIVPRHALTFIANTLYGENYSTLHMKHEWENQHDTQLVEYLWMKENWHRFKVHADLKPIPIVEGSEEEFISEHYWGYTKIEDRITSEYQVEHPRWMVYPVRHSHIDVDFFGLYGPEFEHLTSQHPHSVLLAEGSEVRVYQGTRL